MPRRQSPRSDPDPRWTSELPPAPGDLRIVQAFVNTADLARGTDLDGPAELARFLAHWSLASADAELDDADLARAVDLREALRSLIRANRGKRAVSDAVVARLDQAASAATVRVRFETGGRTRFEAAADHLDGALARLCAIVAAAQIDDSWRSMKICSGTVCRAAFFDFSRNHSAKYCQVQCGNRISALSYKRRHLEHRRKMDAVYSHGRRYVRGTRKSPFFQ